MVIKILVTLLVIAGCYLYLKRRSSAASQSSRLPPAAVAEPLPVKMIATLLLVASLLGSLSYVGYRWYDSHTLLNVRIINPVTGSEVTYQVYKGDLQNRSFTTVEGQTVRIADSERLEISRSSR